MCLPAMTYMSTQHVNHVSLFLKPMVNSIWFKTSQSCTLLLKLLILMRSCSCVPLVNGGPACSTLPYCGTLVPDHGWYCPQHVLCAMDDPAYLIVTEIVIVRCLIISFPGLPTIELIACKNEGILQVSNHWIIGSLGTRLAYIFPSFSSSIPQTHADGRPVSRSRGKEDFC